MTINYKSLANQLKWVNDHKTIYVRHIGYVIMRHNKRGSGSAEYDATLEVRLKVDSRKW